MPAPPRGELFKTEVKFLVAFETLALRAMARALSVKPCRACQLSQRESQGLRLVAEVLGAMRKFPAVLLPLPLRKDFPRSGGRCRAAMTERAHAVSLGTKVLGAVRKLSGVLARERLRGPSYIITLYRQCETQTGIDGGLYYPPESIQCCQAFPCKILSRKISTIFGDCYKTQNIVVFCLTCH